MIKVYFLSAIRSLWRNKNQTIVNLIGLSLGLTCSMVIFFIIHFELSYDAYHPGVDRVYRVVTKFTSEGDPEFTAAMTYPLPKALAQDFPDLEHLSIIDSHMSDPVLTVTDDQGTPNRYKEQHVTFVDPDYFNIFSYDWIEGNPSAMENEKTAIITKSMAHKYFGERDAINRVINFNNEYDVTVRGVVDDLPSNTSFPFQVFLSTRLGADERGWDDWDFSSGSVNCFIQLNTGVTKETFETKLNGWHLKYFTGNSEESGKHRQYFLQPLSELHFDTRFDNFSDRVISYLTLMTLAGIGFLLLLTACINFINLNTVMVMARSKEAGIRKVVGSSRSQLMLQFLGETFIITLVSLLFAGGLVELVLIKLTPVLGYQLSFQDFTDTSSLLFLAGLPIVVSILAGLYPAIKISTFQPIDTFKNALSSSQRGITLRRALIIFQLTVAQVLIVCTIVIVQQINHFMAKPLGLASESVVEFELPENTPASIHQLSERLKLIPGVVNVSMSNTGAIGDTQWQGGFEATVADQHIETGTTVKFADENFIDTYQIKLLQGENLLKSDTANRFLVNEAFVKALGLKTYEDAIGIPVSLWGRDALIQGVIQDFNTTSLHTVIDPAIILAGTRSYYVGAVRLSSNNLGQTLAAVQKTWEDVYPKYVFELSFLDNTISKFYSSERRNAYLISVFAGVAIFIGCIGLYGLISFMSQRKTKEIGIRKTLGASTGQIIGLFSKEFLLLILLAFIMSIPISYYSMDHWLRSFAYRIQPSVLFFIQGLFITLVIVLVTVGAKSYKAASANPVEGLRNE